MTMTSAVSPPLEIDPADIDLVYSAACRQVRDAHLAEDVTQAVFLLMRRKGQRVPCGPARAGWLIKATCFVSKTAIRQAIRRRKHEQKAAAMAPAIQTAADEGDWAKVAVHLDGALATLGERDRTAVVLRYMQDRPLKEVARALGVSESGAGKRVARALQKLRTELAARGVTASTAGLSAMLPLHAVKPAPVELTAAVRAGHASPAGIALSHVRLGMFAAAKAVAAGGTVLALTVGVVWMGTILYRSTPPAPIAMPTPAAAHSLRLTIIDPDTKTPLPGVDVTVRIDQQPRDYVTDAQGVCVVELPAQAPQDIMIRTYQSGRVPMQLWWPNYASMGVRGGVPSALTLSMQAATTVGGTVVDDAGKPVAGASVAVFIQPMQPVSEVQPQPAIGGYPVTTDAQGRWTCDLFPTKTSDPVTLRVKQKGLADTDVTLAGPAKLLDRSYQVVMKQEDRRSIAVHVIDPSGKPVAGARIMIGTNQYDPNFIDGKADEAGRFQFIPRKPERGELAVTAIVPGFAPTIRNIDPRNRQELVELKMDPGRAIRGKVLRPDGSPFVGAKVQATSYHRTGLAEEGYAESNFLPYQALVDAEGNFTYSTAPTTGTTTITASADGFMTCSLEFKDNNEATATLYPTLKVHGKVTDARTGKKIESFRVVQGTETRGNILKDGKVVAGPWINWIEIGTGPRKLGGGWYELTFGDVASGYALRVEADGYLAQVCPTIRPGPADVTVDFKLEPGKNVTGVVRKSDGSPVQGADVVLIPGNSGGQVRVKQGRLTLASEGTKRLKTGDDGRYEFPPPLGAYRVIAIHPEIGYANLDDKELAKNGGELRLAAWGKVQGTVKAPKRLRTSDLSIFMDFPSSMDKAAQRVLFEAMVDVDAKGHFLFDKVPSAARDVRIIERGPAHGEGLPKGSRQFVTLGPTHGVPITVKPGKTTRVEIALRGRPVIGHIMIPPEMRSGIDWNRSSGWVNAAWPDPPSPKPWKTMSDQEKRAWGEPWSKTAEGKAWIAANQPSTQLDYRVHLKPDGTFRVEDVPAGKYAMDLTIYGPMGVPKKNQQAAVGLAHAQFTVPPIPGGESDEPLDLGTLSMSKPVGR